MKCTFDGDNEHQYTECCKTCISKCGKECIFSKRDTECDFQLNDKNNKIESKEG